MKDVRTLRTLLETLREHGVTEYVDGTLSIKLAPAAPKPRDAEPAADEPEPVVVRGRKPGEDVNELLFAHEAA